MTLDETAGGVAYDRLALDRAERRLWRDVWASVPAAVAAERGIELRRFGPVQASIVAALPELPMLNLVLGSAERGATEGGHLAAACGWARSRGINAYVPVTPGLPGAEAAEEWLAANGFQRGYAWMKFVRDAHAPRFTAPEIEVVELGGEPESPFGMIVASGFGLPAWASTFFDRLPGVEGWHCYLARVAGEAQACAAMRVDEGLAELAFAATLEAARGLGCQLALLHRRIVDAAASGCHTLFVETGERVPGRLSASYRNILRAGFEEAYLRPNWQRRPA